MGSLGKDGPDLTLWRPYSVVVPCGGISGHKRNDRRLHGMMEEVF